MNNTEPNNKIEAEKLGKAEMLINETRIKLDTFNFEAEKRVKDISAQMEEARHSLNVAEHDIGKEIVDCLQKITDADNSIMLPEEVLQ